MALNKTMIQRPWLFIALLLLISGLPSCDSIPTLRDISPTKETAAAENIIERLRSGDIAAVEALVSRELAAAATEDQLKSLIGYFPAGEPIDKKVVGFNAIYTLFGKSKGTFNIEFEYQYLNKWVLASVYFEQLESGPSIRRIHVYQMDKSLEETNRFHLSGKSAIHYATLSAAISVALFTIYALYLSFRNPRPDRKWLWRCFIACGFCSFSINWTTGQWMFQPISFAFLSAGARATPYGPWFLSVYAPIGAVIFMIRRRHISRPHTSNEQAAPG